MVKRKTIIDIVNRHLSLNINFDLDQLLDEEELIEIIDQVMDQHNLDLEYFYSITNSSGLILFSNFEKKENELLINSTIFSVYYRTLFGLCVRKSSFIKDTIILTL